MLRQLTVAFLFTLEACLGMMPIIAPGMNPATVVSQRVTGVADARAMVKFTIYLKIPREEKEKLTATVNAVSDPSSERYGKKRSTAFTMYKNCCMLTTPRRRALSKQ